MRPAYPPEVREKAVRLYVEENLSTYQVAEKIGCTRPTVCNWLREEAIPTRGKQPECALTRFWSKVDLSGDCWEWTAGTDKDGYGKFWDGKTTVRSIRFIYEWAYGEDPGDLFVCHSCDNPACVRPDHLWLGTVHDNNMDFITKGRYNKDSWRFPNFVGGLND